MENKVKKLWQWVKRHVTITNEWKDIREFGDLELVSVYYNHKFKMIVLTISNFRVNIWF